MSSLKDLQARFQAGILSGDDSVLADVKDSANEDRTALFGVYRNAYVLRLLEILGNDYELTHAYVGDATFAKLARGYVAAHPSDQRNARWFGRHLPAFAKDTPPFSGHPEIAEIAALENALADAFDGPDADPLTTEDLGAVTPDDWPNLVFTPHPTATQLRFTTNAADIWLALKEETAPPDLEHLPEPQTVLVWRQEFTSRFRPLHAEEAMMWNEAIKGARFGVLCEMVATFAGVDEAGLRAATYLKAWIDAGLLTGAGCQPALDEGAGNKALERPVSQ
ncbi:MAG: HvfC/BufC N-terminal domain-containing protein [Alphaproteobacteria bacterium]